MHRRTLSRVLAAVSVTSFTLTAAAAAFMPAAQAASGDGSDWGPSGTLVSNSQATVRWDNQGNSPANTVPRDDDSPLPHTAGKTYADLNPDMTAAEQDLFGNLQMTVSQTTDLVNQTVTVSVSGAKGGTGRTTGSYVDVFQCWGAPLPDGSPDPNATAPDPETCQVGVSSADPTSWGYRIDEQDDADLVVGSDWEHLAWNRAEDGSLTPTASPGSIPFRPIGGTDDGTGVIPDRKSDNPYFTADTTNELVGKAFLLDTEGSASRPFEVQTQTESLGLGCGITTTNCWLVAVPKSGNGPLYYPSLNSALSPTLWANRLQVELSFSDADTACSRDASRTLTAGSELADAAMNSWIPELCDGQGVALGYTLLGDRQVRTALDAGERDQAVISSPATQPASYLPVALAGTVIGYRIDNTATGEPVTDLKLNARLVAKLLTETYRTGVDNGGSSGGSDQSPQKAPWLWAPGSTFRNNITEDKEFQALNPTLTSLYVGAGSGDLVVSLTDSDAARAVWTWVLADPDARSFLSGCPDDWGMVVNPFYSSRTYQGCQSLASGLDAVAAKRIGAQTTENPTGTATPEEFRYDQPTWPWDSGVFPQPSWYARDAVTVPDPQLPLGLTDMHPRTNSLGESGRDVARAIYPQNTQWCAYVQDVSCSPEPGRWKSNAGGGQIPGQQFVMAVTDTPTAAKFQVPTALLCGPYSQDPAGDACVGASTSTLLAAASRFVDTDTTGVQTAGPADYEAKAYPMTLPVYAALHVDAMSVADAKAFATAFDYATTDGQTPGFTLGNLPPGYAPLTGPMRAQAANVIQALRAGADLTALTEGMTVTPGGRYRVDVPAGTFNAGETVTGEVQPDAIGVGSTTAQADGSLAFVFTMPNHLAAGRHGLVLTGADSGNTYTVTFLVASSGSTATPTPTPTPSASVPPADDGELPVVPGPQTTVTPPTHRVPQATAPASGGTSGPTPKPSPSPSAPAPGAMTGATEIGFPQYGLAGGLAAGVVTGVASPLVGRKRRVELD